MRERRDPGREEYLHSEKYEYKVWDWDRPGNIKRDIAILNRFRRENPALHELTNLRFLDCPDPNILAYAKATADRSNIVIAVVNLDPHGVHGGEVVLPLAEWGIADDAGIFCRGGVYRTRYRVARRAPAPCARSADQPRVLVPRAARQPIMSPPDDAPAVLPGRPRWRAPKRRRADPLWYKDAIIYQLHVKAFFDANNDGIGDFEGLTRKLDYLQDLGVTALWLLPFYPSPLRDDGYDIADYKNIHPAYGRMADFKAFVREAHRRGLRVITELVINHTSDQHPWFQRARRAPARARRCATFMCGATPTRSSSTPASSFIDTEKSNWTWDPVAQAYYWHRFYSHQPDLNFDNPRVFRAIANVMRFWLDLGVDGMRLDAVPYLIEREGTNNENLPETHEVLKPAARARSTATTATACCSPRPTSGRRTCCNISAPATNATWRSTSR